MCPNVMENAMSHPEGRESMFRLNICIAGLTPTFAFTVATTANGPLDCRASNAGKDGRRATGPDTRRGTHA